MSILLLVKYPYYQFYYGAVFTWLPKGTGFGFGFGFTTPFGWLVYLLWFWFYDSQVKTALIIELYNYLKSYFSSIPFKVVEHSFASGQR